MGKIKALLRSVFRYRLISAFFIISQLVMFYAVFGVLSIYNKAYAGDWQWYLASFRKVPQTTKTR